MNEHDTPEWRAERLSYIGASEAAEAVGMSRWGDPITLWEVKTGQRPQRDESFRMRLGSLIEPVIGTLASEALGRKLRRVAGPIRHPIYPFIAANPDFRVVGAIPGDFGRALVQAKYRLDGVEWGDPDAGEGLGIPMHYRIQGWAEMLATGLDSVIFAMLDPRQGLGLWPLVRAFGENEAAIADLEADLVEFWQEYVVKGVMPPPSAESKEALARRFPRAKAKIGKLASASQEVTLEALLVCRDEKKVVERQEEELKNLVRAMIGDAEFIEGVGHQFRNSNVKGGSETYVEWEQVARSYRAALSKLDERIRRTDSTLFDVATFTPTQEDLDAIESLYTRTEVTEPSRRFTVVKLK